MLTCFGFFFFLFFFFVFSCGIIYPVFFFADPMYGDAEYLAAFR